MPVSQGALLQGPESGKDPATPSPPLPTSSSLVCGNLWNAFYIYDPLRRPLSSEGVKGMCAVSPNPFGDAGPRLGDLVTQEKTWFMSRSQVPDVEVSPSRPCTCHLPICQGSRAHLSLPREEGHIGGPVTLPALVSDKPSGLRRSYDKAPFPSEWGRTKRGLPAEV